MPPLYCVTIEALLLLSSLSGLGQSLTRTYYIGIVEEAWDYAPSGRNLISGLNISADEHASVFLENGKDRIGRVYKKALYKQFTDARYTEEVTKPAWLGLLGPVIKAEVEDTIIVKLKNFASRSYTLHPHGVFYEKDSEGAFYPDGTRKSDKRDDAVPPRGHHTYTWIVKPEYAPTPEDPNCLTWIYHSHIDAPKDIASGLIGALLTCKKGTLDSSLNRVDVDKDFVLMFYVIDENISWYLEENIQTFCSEPDTVEVDNEDFQESNKMHALNGYLYGNLPAVDMCLGDSVSWHLFGMGNEVDIHSAFFYGHTVTNQGHRTDVINLFPATFVTVEMTPSTPGSWMLSCQVNDHIQAGMMGLYNVGTCGHPPTALTFDNVKKYFIAAEKIMWNYAPNNYDRFTHKALDDPDSHSATFFTKSSDRIGGSYWKVHYTEYTDESFTTKKTQSKAEEHLGILGPVIKAEAGDTIMVVFSNKADRNYSMMPHGLSFGKDSEGAPYIDGGKVKPGAHVAPGETFTYTWNVPEKDGPTASDPRCLAYMYYSASDPVRDTNSGLVGPLVVCKKGSLSPDNTQVQIEQEFFLLFTVFDENLSWYLEENIEAISSDPFTVDVEDEDFQESNKMHAINGFMFGDLPGLQMCRGDNVSWHLLGLGTEIDIHGIYFQGNTLSLGGTTRDTVSLFPHTSVTASMQPDQAGIFELGCQTMDHYISGMKHTYTVQSCDHSIADEHQYGAMRTYFIAAEETEWDYSPDRSWELEKHNITEHVHESPGHIFVSTGEDRIGSKYKKVVYREYTDGHFTEPKKRSAEEEHLEIMGPFVRAEVGESILIVFKNKASRPYSIYAHGVQVADLDGGSVIQNTLPGGTSTYHWNVPERSGPGSNDPDCLTWAYYSKEDYMKDMYSGLIGPLLTCRKGVLDNKGRRKDVAREFALLFLVFDENLSWYLDDNIETYVHKDPAAINMTEEFEESNKIHAINGKIYGNLHGLTMTEGEKTNWHLLGMGNEVDMHTVHFHAQSFLYKKDRTHRADVFDLFPGTFQTIELVAGNPGTWLLHCHVTDHIHAGMETTFTVRKKSDQEEGSPVPADSDEQGGIPFLGRILTVDQAHAALLSLLAIGVVLLLVLVAVLIILSCRKNKMYYSTINNGSIPMNSI
ncbi:ferroxidase HEPHL1 [Anomaloglossus baeobatrachus]|uniref:ferroxidase HEPHL1 n=1 Tax=Anomaloglossus baeobatrachus TaxID=238106 RepID=UPI003F4F9C0B